MNFDPTIFTNVETLEQAARVILTDEDDLLSSVRWKTEAPYLINEIILKHCPTYQCFVDYGCGVGRLSRPLLMHNPAAFGIGVDLSPNMRALAVSCVDSNNFIAIPPEATTRLRHSQVDLAIAVWTLQHCYDVDLELDRISYLLKPEGTLIVVNNYNRVIPVSGAKYPWADDAVNVKDKLQSRFGLIAEGALSDAVVTRRMSEWTFWAVYANSLSK